MNLQILIGDCRVVLPTLASESVQCCVTSPPYWGLRDYGHDKQLGMEATYQEYVANMVEVFSEVWRVLKPDGTLWLNLGDSYATSAGKVGECPGGGEQGARWKGDFANGHRGSRGGSAKQPHTGSAIGPSIQANRMPQKGLKPKDLVGIPWRVALALQAEGWYLRSDIIWAKPNPMPESVTDRPTKSHEYIFLLTKSASYYYDYEAIKEPPSPALLQQIADGYNGDSTKLFETAGAQDASGTKTRIINGKRAAIEKIRGHSREHEGFTGRWDNLTKVEQQACGANKRSVWSVATAPFKGAHFATYPPELITPCILAGTKPGDVVLDPFGGSGTTAATAMGLGRSAITIELNPEYAPLIEQRTNITHGLALT